MQRNRSYWDSGYFQYNSLNKMHIELSSLCNSICPNCPRYYRNSPNELPELLPQSISIEKFKEWFPPELLANIDMLLLCGNHGDPGTCKDLLPIMEYLYEYLPDDGTLQMHTNGGMKTEKVWDRIGELFAKRDDGWKMIFSIDGLEDTNHIYRRNVRWDKLMKNVKAYTKHGGNSDWEFLIFKHNEHQIEEAKRMTEEVGIRTFSPKIAHGLDDGKDFSTMPALNKDGTVDYHIYPPAEKKNRVNYIENSDNTDIIKIRNLEFGQGKPGQPQRIETTKLDNPLAFQPGTTGLDRLSEQELKKLDDAVIRPRCHREVFVSAAGFVTPCCWIGLLIPFIDDPKKVSTFFEWHQLKEKMMKIGLEKFNLHNDTLENILNENRLNEVYSDDWNKTTACGKLAECTKQCGLPNVVDDTMSHEDNPYKEIRSSTDHREHLVCDTD